jgi:putative transposase
MARPLRIEQEDAFYHVLSRGNERRAVFRDDADRHGFLARLGRCAARFELEPFAYVLMGNHYHLLVRTRRANLSRAMQWLGVSYSAWHNARHRRSGHLFQGRFKSFLVEEQAYLYRLLLYVHRNPLRARLVERLADYPWSSYRALAGGRGGPSWFDAGRVHRYLDIDARDFRRAVGTYDDEKDNLLAELHCGLVLGSASVLEALRRRWEGHRDREKPQLRQLEGGPDFEARLTVCRRLLRMDEREYHSLLLPLRRTVRPRRDLLIYLLWRQGGLSLSAIGQHFGIDYPAVSLAKGRGEAHLRNHKALRRQLTITI